MAKKTSSKGGKHSKTAKGIGKNMKRSMPPKPAPTGNGPY